MMSDTTTSKVDTSKPIAWVVSIGVHLGIGLLAFVATWSIVRTEEDPPRVVTSVWHEQPVNEKAKLPMVLPPAAKSEMELPELALPQESEINMQDGFAVLHEIATSGVIPEFARREPETEVQFMGLDAVSAKRIVYVVDASGSMLLRLPEVYDEVERSLKTLHPKQSFGIIFCKNGRAVIVPPKRTLVFATASNIEKAMEWIASCKELVGSSSSDPLNALKAAFNVSPDVVYLLSQDIEGKREYVVNAVALLEELDRLNPIDTRNGLRKVKIKCIQYWGEKQDQLMQKIAEIHGGNDGYTFIERGRVGK